MMIFVILAAVIVTLLIIYVIRESSGFRSVSYTVRSDKIPKDLKIVLLADLHNKDYGNANEPLIEAIDAFSPDFVCFSGDMVTSGWDLSFDFEKTLVFMEKLAKKYPVYYGIGNHEEYFQRLRDRFPTQFDEMKEKLSSCGIPLLDNEKVVLEHYNTVIYGLKLDNEYYRRVKRRRLPESMMEDLLGPVDRERFSILLAHNPEHFEDYAAWGPDLVLSGHVHGGIICLPLLGGVVSPGVHLFPKYDFGLFTEGKSTMLLTRGAGSHSIPVRINNKAEVVCLTVEQAAKE